MIILKGLHSMQYCINSHKFYSLLLTNNFDLERIK